MNEEKLRCPFCEKELKQGENKIYETLCDHVLDPNQEEYERPLRPTLICNCEMSKDCFWDDYGDFYTSNREQNYYDIECEAINSSGRKSTYEFKLWEKRRKKWWYKVYLFFIRLKYQCSR